jgi:hypothetical protein
MVPGSREESLINIKWAAHARWSTSSCQPTKGADMNERFDDEEVPEEPIPAMQQLLDNPFLLLFLGIAMPTVLYIVWGVMEIVSLPIAK